MCKTISVISCKGGVGKTTTAVNIGAYMQTQGKRVCAVDLDPQHNLSRHFGILPGQLQNRATVYDLINAEINGCEDSEIEEIVRSSIYPTTTADVIPSTVRLSSLETVLPMAINRERLLKNALTCIQKDYDYILLDCRPGLDMFAINALTASDSVIIPVEAHILSSDGLEQVEKILRTVQRSLNPDLKIEGVLITKYQGRTNCCREIRNLVLRSFGDHIRIFDSCINYAISVAEAPAFGISLHEYAPGTQAARAYSSVAEEVMQSA